MSEQELLRYCAEQLDPYKCPHRIAIKDDLRRNAHGKVSRRIRYSLACLGGSLVWDFAWL